MMKIDSFKLIDLKDNNIEKKQIPSSAISSKKCIQMKNIDFDARGYYNKIKFAGVVNCYNMNFSSKHKLSNYLGCLLGGAIGDAMGAPLEFLDEEAIQQRYGDKGLRYVRKKGSSYKFTDDTQMTIFTIKGLLNSFSKINSLIVEPDYNIIYDAYQDWYKTQINANTLEVSENNVFDRKELYAKRGPGLTCLTALESNVKGTIENPVNNSYGNGAVMRSAPIGLMYYNKPELAFKIGVKAGALTHGHHRAYLPAGFQAALIANIVKGYSLSDSINNSIAILSRYSDNQEFMALLKKAISFAKSDIAPNVAIKTLGRGFAGDEAVAISVYCALKNPDNYKKAITMAINHGGDSDTTGAITGNILGAYLGSDAISRNLKENLELSDLLNKCAGYLFIEDSEEKMVKNIQKEFEKKAERVNDIKYDANVFSIKVSNVDIEKMKTMTIDQKLEFLKQLKDSKRFRVL